MKEKNSGILAKSAKKFDNSLKSIEKEKSGQMNVGFKDYMSFRIFKTVSENVKEYMPADYQFYQGKDYYQPAKIGIFTRILTEIMLKVVFFMMRDMSPSEV